MEELGKFSLWAGLFMQIAGVLEVLRRLAENQNAFTVQPAAPTATMAGAAAPRIAATTRHTTTVRTGTSIPVIIEEEDSPASEAAEEAVREHKRWDLSEIRRIVNGYTPETFVKYPSLENKIKLRLQGYLILIPGKHEIDEPRCLADEFASEALDLWWKVDALANAARSGKPSEPLTDSDE